MHLPKINEEKNWDTIAAFIRQYPFAMLISVMDAKPVATHLPVELFEKTPGQFVLQGHVAKANPQWQAFTTGTALAIFSEPHAYVSSSWYEKDKIPTWNYIAVHVYGSMNILSEEELHLSLERMMNNFESGAEKPVKISDIPADNYRNNLKAIVGFEMQLDDVQAKFKLSQNKNDTDYCSVVQHLEKSDDQQEQAIALEMRKRRGGCPT